MELDVESSWNITRMVSVRECRMHLMGELRICSIIIYAESEGSDRAHRAYTQEYGLDWPITPSCIARRLPWGIGVPLRNRDSCSLPSWTSRSEDWRNASYTLLDRQDTPIRGSGRDAHPPAGHWTIADPSFLAAIFLFKADSNPFAHTGQKAVQP